MANRTDFINKMYESGRIYKKDAKEYINIFTDTLIELLKEEGSVTLIGLGKFELKHVNEGMVKDPRNGETVYYPAHDKITFKMSKSLKEEWRNEQKDCTE
ncbi:MAG: HU family DNA-binding protein [Eubacteriales bacterium]|nr:HU family DNA-binding protein [Eubacteriales bacterium]